jgi:hypothetical protein
MNKVLFTFILSAFLFIACKKEGLPGSPSVRLSATTFYNNGFEETRFEQSGTIERNSYGQVAQEGTNTHYLVNLGANGQAPDQPVFGISFLFVKKKLAFGDQSNLPVSPRSIIANGPAQE